VAQSARLGFITTMRISAHASNSRTALAFTRTLDRSALHSAVNGVGGVLDHRHPLIPPMPARLSCCRLPVQGRATDFRTRGHPLQGERGGRRGGEEGRKHSPGSQLTPLMCWPRRAQVNAACYQGAPPDCSSSVRSEGRLRASR
jgi:hypothetical protein